MGGIGNKEMPLFARDEDGKLIGQIVKLENKETIISIPLTKGQIKKLDLLQEIDRDNYILKSCLICPKLNDEDLKFIRPNYVELILNKILTISGLNINKKKKSNEKEDDFGRNLRRVKSEREEGDLTLFLHKQGYNFFTIGALTYAEISNIVEAWNHEQKNKEKSMKKNSKGKR